MIENSDIENNLKKIITNFKKIYNFIFLYKDELITILEDNTTINNINNNINNNKIDLIIKNIDKNFIKITNNNLDYYIEVYNNIEELKIILKNNINYINQIDIFEKKYLISETSKNNINQNKNLIIDLYNKYTLENNKLLIDSTILIFNNLDINNKYNDIFIIIKKFLDLNYNIIDLYLFYINKIKTLNIDKIFSNSIKLYNNKLKDNILLNNLTEYNIKYNNNLELLFNNNKIFNNNYYIINKLHIFNNYSKYILKKKYYNLSDLFKNELNITKFPNITYKDKDKISTIINLYYKIDKIPIVIILIKSNLDKINYNLTSLLDSKNLIDSKLGINKNFIEKTKTIMTQSEYLKKLENINNYINNIEQITIYHNKFLYNKETNLNEISNNYNVPVLLINYDNHFYSIFSKNKSNLLKLKNVYNIIINKPNYSIENYNNIINHNIVTKINNFNILNKYTETINNTYNLYSNINHIELKNLIINKIKNIKIPINNTNKNKIIDEILELINLNVFEYILKKTNIQFQSELLMVYLSNINSIINKIKKELVDNFTEQLLINIDQIITDQYHNIQTIIDNILDKYYTLHI